MSVHEFKFEYNVERVQTLSKKYMEDHFATHYSIDDVNEELRAISVRRNVRPLFKTMTKVATLSSLRSDPTVNALSKARATLFKRRNGVKDWMQEHRLMSQLIELVESLKVEQLCCDFLDEQLTLKNFKKYIRHNGAALSQEHGDDKKMLRKRFNQHIIDLYKLLDIKPNAIEITSLAIKHFRKIRDDIFSNIDKIRFDFRKQFEKVTFGEKNVNIEKVIYKELKICCSMREKIFQIGYDLKLYKLTDEIYNNVVSSIRKISYQLNQFDPATIPPDCTFCNLRTAAMIDYRNVINKSLIELLNDLVVCKLDSDTADLKRRESIYDRHIEILIMEVPKPLPLPVNSSLTSAPKCRHQNNTTCKDAEKLELREHFSNWYHSLQKWVGKRNSERQLQLEQELLER